MASASSSVKGVASSVNTSIRCYNGHRRSSSLPISHPFPRADSVDNENAQSKSRNDSEGRQNVSMNVNGLVDTFNQIQEGLSRPSKLLMQILDEKENLCNGSENVVDEKVFLRIVTALKQLKSIQGNLKHVLPHFEEMMNDYSCVKERDQSREEMLKTLDKALRCSEGRCVALSDQLQDMRDENKCLREKAQQNESILRFLHKDKTEISRPGNETDGPTIHKDTDTIRHSDLTSKLEHYQKVLLDYEIQLKEVVTLNKDLVLKIDERESEVMRLNSELMNHQETLAVYEQSFNDVTNDNNELSLLLRTERKRAAELSEKLDDTEGYISCITDKVASYEVELQYLRKELKKSSQGLT